MKCTGDGGLFTRIDPVGIGAQRPREQTSVPCSEKAQLFADVPGAGTVLRTLSGIETGYRYMLAGNRM